MTRIGFCGTGAMGLPMAIRLVEAGHEVTVWNRTASRAAPALERGASPAASPAEAAAGAEVVVTMLSTPEALEEVLFGPGGLAEGLEPGAALVEMSTVGVEAVRSARERLAEEVELVDAPVLGSIPQAEEGSLAIFVGASEGAFDRLAPLLAAMGRPRRVGPFGAGAAMKLVTNSTLPTLMAALGEALALGDALGLEEPVVLDVLAASSLGATTTSKRSRVESGAYPPNFPVRLAAKDAGLVRRAAEAGGVSLAVAEAAEDRLRAAMAAGMGDLDYSALIAHIRGRPAGTGPE